MLPKDLSRATGQLAHELGLSCETIFFAAWARLLCAYTGSESAVFGVRLESPRSERDVLWPVQLMLGGHRDVREWLKAAQRIRDDLENQLPVRLSELHSRCGVSGGQTLFETLLDFTGADCERFPAHPLELRFSMEGGEIVLVYCLGSFDDGFIQRLSEQFVCLLESLVERMDSAVSSLNLLPERQREQILVAWNQTRMDFPDCDGAHRLFEQQVARTPDAVALIVPRTDSGNRREVCLTYRELNSSANRLANYLRSLGVDRERRVGICLDRSKDLVVSLLAVLKSGGAYVPLDPSYPAERLAFILQDAQLHAVLTSSAVISRLSGLQRDAGASSAAKEPNWVCLDNHDEEIRLQSDQRPSGAVAPNNLAYVIYTSGSTGQPKGVAIEHRSTLLLLHWARTIHAAEELKGVLAATSICFDLSVFELLVPLSWGGCVILADNALQLATLPRKNEVSLMNTVPSAIAGLIRMNGIPPSVRTVNLAGEPLTQHLVQQLYALPWIEKVYDLYGPTEDGTYSTFALRRPDEPATIGRPMANKQAYILDLQFQPVPIGVTGELCIGGEGLARGYLNRPDLTAERFIPNPFGDSAHSRLYRTGDLARWRPNGNIEYLGRIDHQVKVRGFRIELGEVETVLCRHPHVREAVVVARDTEVGDKQLVAYVVPIDGAVRTTELRTFLKDRLPSYSIPSHFVPLPSVPLTPNGKVDRRALPMPAETEIAEDSLKLPRDPLEVQLKLIFEKVLNRRPIGIDESFFDLGGDSLQALRVVVEIEKVTRKRLPIEILYGASSVEALAGRLRRQSSESEWSSLVALQPSGKRSPFFWVHTTPGDVLGYGNLICHLDPDQPSYGFQSRGLCSADLCHTRLEDMAAYYARLLRSVQPQGPYFLGGWCYGGIVAVEMAHQLLAEGEKVAPLFLLETPAPAPALTNVQFYARRVWRLLRMTSEQWRAYLVAKYEYFHWRRGNRDMRFLQAAVETTDQAATDEEKSGLLTRLEHVYRTNLLALERYKPRRYPGKVILFNATEPPASIIRDPLYGWPALAAEIETHFVPGNHDAILAEPHVRVLAEKISECLQLEQRQHVNR